MRRRSLSIQMLVSLVFWATLILTLYAVANAWVYRNRSVERLKQEAALAARQLETAIGEALWHYNIRQIDKVLDGVMDNRIITAVVVLSEVDSFARRRNSDWISEKGLPDEGEKGGRTITTTRSVMYMGENLGRINLWVTPKFLDREIVQAGLYFAGTIVLLDVVLVLILYSMISRIVITPLRKLQAYALSASRGGTDIPEPPMAFTGEMEVLRHAMARMLAELNQRYEDGQKQVRRFRDSEERFRILVNTIPDYVWLKDPDGVFLSCNKTFCALLNLYPEEILGRTDYDLWSESLADFFREKDRMVMDAGKALNNEERMPGPDGQDIILDTIKAPVFYADGKLMGVMGIARDITARVQAEEEKIKLKEQLNQAQKIESVGRLAGGVAHDFNNMLAVIRGYADLAEDEPGLPSLVKDYLHEISEAADRSADLTRQLLAFARKEEVSPRLISLNEALGGMLKMLKRLIGEDIELEWLPGKEVWSVKMDPSQLDHILVNLCLNARDAIKNDGRIAIETRNIEVDEDFCGTHPNVRPGEFVMLAVTDNGEGISKTVLPNIFDPFFTTKVRDKGTGLGLSTVYGVTQQAGGFITVYSEPGLGSAFHIYLPRAQGTGTIGPEREKNSKSHSGTETVLLVEDEVSILSMITNTLEKQGYTVLATESPVKAVELAAQFDGRIDLLLTDVVMPKINGKDLFLIIKKDRPDIRGIFMSGYTADVIHKAEIEQIDGRFIQKPFSNKELFKTVRDILG
nr:ATP-binding protein [uncultured Desulfobacter sp.]